MKIAILGYGDQGRSAYDYWNAGNDITICDLEENLPNLPFGVRTRLGPDYLWELDNYDLIVRSPSVHPSDIIKANSPQILEKVTTITEEFMRVCPARIIGVTGTKGKGTTSALITKILEQAGNRVHLGGNIGIPPLDLLRNRIEPSDWVVLELANFQLIDLRLSPAIAVCLMVVPEHLNWHEDMAEYIRSKQNLFRYQDSGKLAVFNRANQLSVEIASSSPARKISYEVPAIGELPKSNSGATVTGDAVCMDRVPICHTSEVLLRGRHNLENVCAAVAATWEIIDGKSEVAKAAIASFTGLVHRLEYVRTLDDVQYYDDSFGTTPETAMVALKAFSEPKVIILGGSDKGADFSQLAKMLATQDIRKVILIGQTAVKIRAALDSAGFHNYINGGRNMGEIIASVRNYAEPGDVVLLSTACASFDMFKDYQDRGDQFKVTLNAL